MFKKKDVTEDTEYSDDFIMKAFGNKTFIDEYIENMLMVEELKMGSSKKCKIWK